MNIFIKILTIAFLLTVSASARANWLELFNEKFQATLSAPKTTTKAKPIMQEKEPLTFIERTKRRVQNESLSEATGVNIPEDFDQKKLTQSGDPPASFEEYKMIMRLKQQDQINALKKAVEARNEKLQVQQENTPNAPSYGARQEIYLQPNFNKSRRLKIQPYSPPSN